MLTHTCNREPSLQVDDLFAYFKFLRYKPYNDATKFKILLKDRIARNPEDGYKVLQLVLQVRLVVSG